MFFFFQAEDGIRDADVTEVQTCALPICLKSEGFIHHQITSTQKQDSLYVVQFDLGIKTDSVKIHFKENIELLQELLDIEQTFQTIPIQNTQEYLQNIVEIGRASCRERV